MSEFEYDSDEDYTTFEATFADIQRTGAGTIIDRYSSKFDRFKAFVEIIANEIKDEFPQYLDNNDIQNIKEAADNLGEIKVEHLNPTAYILGYVSRTLTLRQFDKSKEIMEKGRLKDESITEPDIIKYARFWHSYNIS